MWLTLEAVKAKKNITDSSMDDAINALLSTAEDQIAQFCPRFVPRQTFTHLFDGMGGDTVVLRKRPVCGVLSVKDDMNRLFPADSLIAAQSYVLNPEAGLLEFDGGAGGTFVPMDGSSSYYGGWLQNGMKNVQVVYVAGYGPYGPSETLDSADFAVYPLPQDIVQLAADLIFAAMNWTGSEGKKSERIGDYSYTMPDPTDAEFLAISPTSTSTIARWADGTEAR